MTTTETALPDTWGEVLEAEVGHIWLDRHEDGVRFLVMRGPAAVCAYIGVPESHPLAGHSYDDVPLDCHGGLTFASAGKKEWPAGWYWYGWDYAHAGDRSTYSDLHPLVGRPETEYDRSQTRWTPKAVENESWSARYHFVKLARLAEKIAAVKIIPASAANAEVRVRVDAETQPKEPHEQR